MEQSSNPAPPPDPLLSQYLIQCSLITALPPVSFNLGGVWFNLTAQDYVIQVGRRRNDVRVTRPVGLERMGPGVRPPKDRERAAETSLVPRDNGRARRASQPCCRLADCSGWCPRLFVRLRVPGHASARRAPLDPWRCLLAQLRAGLRPREHDPRRPRGTGARSLSGSRALRGWPTQTHARRLVARPST